MKDKILNQKETMEIVNREISVSHIKSLEIIPTMIKVGEIYNFDPEGWDVFYATDGLHVGATAHYAVNRTTGEYRYLGMIGE